MKQPSKPIILNTKLFKWTLSLLFGISVFCFWYLVRPNLLSHQEQYQFFLYLKSYFVELISRPTGLVDYIARFITQFYYYRWLGALILAFLFVVLQCVTWQIMVALSPQKKIKHSLYPLSFLSPVIYWGFLCDENFMLAGLISLLFIVLFSWLILLVPKKNIRLSLALLSIPVLFWFAGGMFWLPFLIILILEKKNNSSFSGKEFPVWFTGGVLIAVASVFFAYNFLVQYPVSRMVIGIGIFRSPVEMPFIQIWGGLTLAIAILLYAFISELKQQSSQIFWCIATLILVALVGYCSINKYNNTETEEYMSYDYCVRHNEWYKIINMANKKAPHTPYAVAYLDLALGKTGQLGNRMFHYYQNGTEGLIPEFKKHYVGALVSSEIYYHLGLINIGQAHAFEAMESIADKQKSVRIIQRLAETNLLNHQYAVAKKYLHLLQKTQFYKNWSNEALICIKDSMRFDSHKNWMYLREIRTTKDFVYSPQEKDMMLGLLYEHNDRNKMAFEYLMAYCLLRKDISHFVKYFSVGRNLNYSEIPHHFQEALVFMWTQNNGTFKGMPWPINPVTKRAVVNYATIYTKQKGRAKKTLKSRYGNTFWYYYHFE